MASDHKTFRFRGWCLTFKPLSLATILISNILLIHQNPSHCSMMRKNNILRILVIISFIGLQDIGMWLSSHIPCVRLLFLTNGYRWILIYIVETITVVMLR